MKLFRNIALFLLLIPFLALSQSTGNNSNEYDLKALFIFNFVKYIDWQEVNKTGNFRIFVLGQSEIMEPLQKLGDQKKMNNRKIEVRQSDDLDEVNGQVLFIPRAMSERLGECISRFSGKGILIITEKRNLASQGAAMNFVMIDNKIKFEVNKEAMQAAGLRISNQLLDLAIVVK